MSDDSRFRSIGEVAKQLGLKPHVLRYWEEQFPQIRPLKRAGGRRHYREEDVALLTRIDQLVHREGYTLKGARTALNSASASASAAPATVPQRSGGSSDLLDGLQAIRADLARALAAAG